MLLLSCAYVMSVLCHVNVIMCVAVVVNIVNNIVDTGVVAADGYVAVFVCCCLVCDVVIVIFIIVMLTMVFTLLLFMQLTLPILSILQNRYI